MTAKTPNFGGNWMKYLKKKKAQSTQTMLFVAMFSIEKSNQFLCRVVVVFSNFASVIQQVEVRFA